MDSGSQRSCRSERLRNQLNLPKLRKERLFIVSLGNSNSKCKIVDTVLLSVITLSETTIIEAICIRIICDSLTNQKMKAVSANYNHLENLTSLIHRNVSMTFIILEYQQPYVQKQSSRGVL